MLKILVAAVMVLAAASCASDPQTQPSPGGPRMLANAEAVDAEIQRLMTEEDVKGLAIAVIEDGQIVHTRSFGFANVEQNRPLQTDTIMYGASLTKTAFAYMVLQLVDEGRLDLDRSIADYLPRPLPEYEDYADLAGDERWRQLTPRIILNHATGFANFRWLEDDEKLRFHWSPGERYGYSGEGIWVLQLVLEQGLGLDVGAEMQRRVFDRFAMTNTSMQWRPDFANNLADGYGIDGAFEPHDQRDNVAAAGSMDTTIVDQGRMWQGIMNGEGLSAASRAELVRSQLAIPWAHQFPTLRTETDPRGAEIGLSAGLGLVTFNDPTEGLMWFKGGHNDWTGNMVVCQEARRHCVVLLSNSVRAERIYERIVTAVLGETAMPWWWEYNN